MSTKKKLIISSIVVVIIMLVSIIFYSNYHLKNTVEIAEVAREEIIELYPVEYIGLPSYTKCGYAFTVTGLSYDNSVHQFFIGNYGKSAKDDIEFHPSIIAMDFEFSQLAKELYFDDVDTGVQGIAYDESNDSVWFTNGKRVINCTKAEGKVISSFTIGRYSRYTANGICIDVKDDSIWILCMYNYLLNFKKDGSLINSYRFDYIGQDHICMDENGNIYMSVGIDYQGDDNFVICIGRDMKPKTIYRVNGSYAIEGILVMDSKLFVLNDGIYHEARIKNNYIQEYLIE